MSNMDGRKLNEDALEKVNGGTMDGMPEPRFHEGDKVIVQQWESYDSTVLQVMTCEMGVWKYRVRIEKHVPGQETSMETVKLEDEMFPV